MAQVISESAAATGNEQRPFYDFLEACLRHKAEMVIFEAARAICNMPEVATRELTPAVTVLQLFLSSAKPVLRFAAVRTLNKARTPLPVFALASFVPPLHVPSMSVCTSPPCQSTRPLHVSLHGQHCKGQDDTARCQPWRLIPRSIART